MRWGGGGGGGEGEGREREAGGNATSVDAEDLQELTM